jgi:hypothetical protein
MDVDGLQVLWAEDIGESGTAQSDCAKEFVRARVDDRNRVTGLIGTVDSVPG